MTKISDILKIGKDKYLEKNLEQKCYNPFREWIFGEFVCFRAYIENEIMKYEIYNEITHVPLEELKNTDRSWKYSISQEDGEFTIKYGIEAYLIWQGLGYTNKKEFNSKFKKELNCLLENLKKEESTKDKIFYEEVHLMRKMTIDWEDFVEKRDKIGSVTYNEKEKAFIEKYGEYYLKFWEHTTDKQKNNYKELENYYIIFEDLYNNHFEDLKLYALMFRNVWLGNCYNDAISVIYFAERHDEIVGYKNILKAQDTLKTQIAFLYYENEALFPYICDKYAKVWFSKNVQTIPIANALKTFKSGIIPQAFSIDDMTDVQCQFILKNREQIKGDYILMYDRNIAPSIDTYHDKIQFTKKYYIPMIAGFDYYFNNYIIVKSIYSLHAFERKRLLRFLFQKYKRKTNLKKEIESIEVIFDSCAKQVENRIQELYRRIQFSRDKIQEMKQEIKKKDELCKLKTSGDSLFIEFLNYEKRKEIENNIRKIKSDFIEWKESQDKKIQEWNDIIDKYKKQVDSIKQHSEERITALLEKTSLWNFVYHNQRIIIYYIHKCNIRAYNICWTRNPNKMRKIDTNENVASDFHKYYKELYTSKEHNIHISYSCLLGKWKESINLEEKRKFEIEKQKEEECKEKIRFNERNKHPFDSTISFRASDHLYIVNGVCLESVTTFVSNCFPKFNAELHAKQKAGALGISVQEVIEKWEQKGKESRDLGTAMHKKIENYYQGIDSANDDTFNLFRIFANNIKLVPYRTEWAVYDWEYKLAGTIDFVDCQNGQYTIYDWKRSDKIIANGMPIKTNKYGEKGNYPLEHIDNSPYYHYALQLSLYKFILERNYGIKVDKLRLGIFHPTYNKPYLLEVPYLESEINSIFNLRSEVIF
jgi:hypothetical protein